MIAAKGERPAKTPKPKMSRAKRVRSIKLFLMVSPFLVLTFIFSYFPLYGWIYAFHDVRPALGLAHAEFVGFQWFRMMVNNPVRVQQILNVLRNTFAISGLGILFSWLPVGFALLLQEVKLTSIKKSIQVLTTLPFYISWVLVFSMAFAIFAGDGMLNNLLIRWGFIDTPILFLQSSERVWSSMTAWGIWKGLGWGAIIYLAAIAGIDQDLYEAARVDGAGRFRLMWHITIPGVIPTFLVLLLLSVASFLNTGFDQFFMFSNAFNLSRIQVLDLWVYNLGFGGGAFSFATSISMLRSIVSITLLFSINALSKVLRGESII